MTKGIKSKGQRSLVEGAPTVLNETTKHQMNEGCKGLNTNQINKKPRDHNDTKNKNK